MFEDIIVNDKKAGDDKYSGKVSYSISLKDSYWEAIKNNPKELGKVFKSIMNGVMDNSSIDLQDTSKGIFDGFELLEMKDGGASVLFFNFTIYDVADEEQKREWESKLTPEERKFYRLDKES